MIQRTHRGRVEVITLRRPERRNALDVELCRALESAVREASASARVVVVTGAGTAFCAGADLDQVYGLEFRTALYSMLAAVTSAPVPVVAAVNGPAIGAGTQLAIACDLRVADPSAVFAVPTSRNGLAVDPWTVRRLALLAGGGHARSLLLGAGSLDAGTAVAAGLATRLGSGEEALAYADQIAEMAPLSLAYSKVALERVLEPAVQDPLLDKAFQRCWDSEDLQEGRRARAERRTPRFQGR